MLVYHIKAERYHKEKRMNRDLTEMVVFLDKSAAMEPLARAVVDGYNSFMDKQKRAAGEANLTTILFNNAAKVFHSRVNVKKAKNLEVSDFVPQGSAVLLNPLGKQINDLGAALHKTDEKDRPWKVIFIIIASSRDNGNKKFSPNKIREMIELQRHVYSWEFIFLGTGIDSPLIAGSLGIQRAFNFSTSVQGAASVFEALNIAAANQREYGFIDSGEEYRGKIK
jgi:hypothetical protein